MKRLIVSLGILLVFALSGRAELTIVLSAAVQNSAVGREIVFSGNLTNTGSSKVYLNDIATALQVGSSAALPLEPNNFFFNVPGILLPGETYSNDEIFRVALGSAASAGDYRGTVTIRGGSDISVNDDLVSASFAVLSPSVTVQATDPSASEFGPDSGIIVITRTGGTDIDLPVPFAFSGSAIAGVDCVSLSSPAIIPAGSSYLALSITPIPNDIAQGDRTAQVNVSPASQLNVGAQTTARVVIHDKPADEWRFEEFGANANDPAASDEASWSGDGIPNLLKFALGLDPKNGVSAGLPSVSATGDYLALSFQPNPNATDVSFIVEGSPDLLTWSAANAEFVSETNPPNIVTYRYTSPISEVGRGFLRLRVLRTDK